MRQYRIFLILLLSAACLLTGFQCDKAGDGIDMKPVWEFSEKLTLYPYKKVYNFNDTIWLQFETANKSLFDELTRSRINTDSSFLQVFLQYNRPYPRENLKELFASVEVVTANNPTFTPGSLPDQNSFRFQTECNNPYIFKVGFIPRKTGIYILQPGARFSSCPDPQKSKYSTFKFIFDLADCNKDIWFSIPSRERGGYSLSEDIALDRKEVFAFRVE